ncbi:MAG: beta-N-acetylhexosaminidase [Woeseia sp.]|nr:beta-N-acetylhexosaminidase [Woeseia sp.]MBT8097069.1 beta-N-acetylhexosaminidase [Woeseia sp.]NNE62075.1 beta-N-acetylhexosaminidase [Woeseia sp.]
MALGPVMLDIEGTALTPADRELLREPAVGGVILFSRNYQSPSQLNDLVSDIRALRRPPLLIAADYEGGRVQRFRDGFTAIPTMRSLGRHFDSDPDEAVTMSRTCGWLIGAELRSMGIDLSFAPCVDLDWGVSEVIGDRSFHRKPQVVSKLALALIRGMRDAGMAAVAKHFPGHGAVVADSHDKLPVDRRPYSVLLDDMQPYEKLTQHRVLAGVMTSHIVYSEMDALPAGFSPYWIKDQLRKQVGFDGAVFSDDLSMKATAQYGTMSQRAHLALVAGCDMVLICNDRPAARAAVARLADYSNPLSLVRLARLHGVGAPLRETLQASDDWQAARQQLDDWHDRPELTLNA